MIECPIKLAAKTFPKAIAIITDTMVISYEMLDHLIDLQPTITASIFPLLGKPTLETILQLFSLYRQQVTPFLINTRLSDEARENLMTLLPSETPLLYSTLLGTSGSTANPKLVILSFSALMSSALASNQRFPLNQNTRWILSLPLFHVSGLSILFRSFYAASAIVISSLPLQEAISTHQITHLSIVPSQLLALSHPLPSVVVALLGGSSSSEKHIAHAKKLSLPVYPTYGMTEMCSQIATADTPYSLLAKPLPGVCISIQEHEVLVKGPMLFSGYVGTPSKIDASGFFHTGDIGTFENGYLGIEGRKDRMMISGGENIHPESIESEILKIDGISAASVIAIPSEEWGARPCAFIEGSVDESTIRSKLKERLPSYAIPDHFFPYPKDQFALTKPNLLHLTTLALKLLTQTQSKI